METKDFADFLAVLNSEGTVYVVIGGMALTANGEQGSPEKFQQWGSGKTLRELVYDSAEFASSIGLIGTATASPSAWARSTKRSAVTGSSSREQPVGEPAAGARRDRGARAGTAAPRPGTHRVPLPDVARESERFLGSPDALEDVPGRSSGRAGRLGGRRRLVIRPITLLAGVDPAVAARRRRGGRLQSGRHA